MTVASRAAGETGVVGLNYRVVDAEYSVSLEKIVMVSEGPHRLHLYDPLAATDMSVDLPLVPTSVSVGPDGLHAAVGHDGWVSYIDLQTGQLVKTMPVSANASDVVLAGNGFVYIFPEEDQWERIRALEIATERETLHTGNLIYDRTRARLHPSGTAIYGANNGLSPSDIEKYSIAAGTASYLYDSPYHGDYPMCGNLWISEDGLRIFTACGRVFRSSQLQAQDMLYDGALSAATRVRDAVHSSEAGKVLVIASQTPSSDTAIQIYDHQFLAFEGTLPLPDFVLPTGSYDAHGRFVFFNGSGSQRFVIVQADPTSGLLFDFAVVTFDATPNGPSADGDGLPDDWEEQFGLNPHSAAGDDGAFGDPDHDGRTNEQEWKDGTHPRGLFTRYFAEGATGSFFDTTFALVNVGPTTPAHVLLRFQKGNGTTVSHPLALGALTRGTLNLETVPGLEAAEFSTVIESDEQVIVDRTMTWDGSAYGSHAETSISTPETTWYLAEGATHSGFNLFYLIQNPNAETAHVEVTYLLPAPTPSVVRTYPVGPHSRFNIWVDTEPGLENTDVSAVLTSTLPIIVERAMYLDRPGQVFSAGHESAAISTPSTEWFLAEGATGPLFDLFVLIANPGNVEASIAATFLLPDGTSILEHYTLAPTSRSNIWVNTVDQLLADTAVSTIITSTNAVPIIVERAMWWPGPTAASWAEAHNGAGLTATGSTFALADGEVGGSRGVETYILIANRGADDAAKVTLLYEDGTSESKDIPLAANSRTNVAVGLDFPNSTGRRFGATIEALGANPQIAVERSMYSNANGIGWAAGTNAAATKLR